MSLFTVSLLATRAGVFGLVVVALFMVSTLLGIMVFLETAMFLIESTIIVLIEEFGILFAFVNFMDDMFSFYRVPFVEASLFIELVAFFAFFALFLFLVVPVSWDNLHQTYRSNTQYVSIWVFFSKKNNEMSKSHPASSWCFFLWPFFSSYSPSWSSLWWWPFWPFSSLILWK